MHAIDIGSMRDAHNAMIWRKSLFSPVRIQ